MRVTRRVSPASHACMKHVLLFALLVVGCGKVEPDPIVHPSHAVCGTEPFMRLNVSTMQLRVDGTLDTTGVPGALLTVNGCGPADGSGSVFATTDEKGEAVLDLAETIVAGQPMDPMVEATGFLPTRGAFWPMVARSAFAAAILLDKDWSTVLPRSSDKTTNVLVHIGAPLGSTSCHTTEGAEVSIDSAPSLAATYYAPSASGALAPTRSTTTTAAGWAVIANVPRNRGTVFARWPSGCTLKAEAWFAPGVVTFVGLNG